MVLFYTLASLRTTTTTHAALNRPPPFTSHLLPSCLMTMIVNGVVVIIAWLDSENTDYFLSISPSLHAHMQWSAMHHHYRHHLFPSSDRVMINDHWSSWNAFTIFTFIMDYSAAAVLLPLLGMWSYLATNKARRTWNSIVGGEKGNEIIGISRLPFRNFEGGLMMSTWFNMMDSNLWTTLVQWMASHLKGVVKPLHSCPRRHIQAPESA